MSNEPGREKGRGRESIGWDNWRREGNQVKCEEVEGRERK